MVCPKSTVCWKVCWNPLAAFSRQLADFLICTYFGKKVKLASFLQIRLFHLVFSREKFVLKKERVGGFVTSKASMRHIKKCHV